MTMTATTASDHAFAQWFDVETPRGEGEESRAIVRELLKTGSEYLFSGTIAPISDHPITISSRTKVVFVDACTIHISIAYTDHIPGSPVNHHHLFFDATTSGCGLLPRGSVFWKGRHSSNLMLDHYHFPPSQKLRPNFISSVWGLFFGKNLPHSAGKQLSTRETISVSDDATIAARFNELVDRWKRDTEYVSDIMEMATHPSYQEIIGMGRPAIPLLLRELKHSPDHWFWALRSISGEDPVPPENRGKIQEMANAWLKWGHEKGYLE